MTNTVNFHPAPEMLEGFAKGTLSTGMSVAISAHVELCAACRGRTSALEAEATVAWLQDQSIGENRLIGEYADLLDQITSQPQITQHTVTDETISEMHMHERSVRLPRVLAKIASDGLVWNKLAGGINQAAVRLDDSTQCEFIYMKPGSQVPTHKHGGNEFTLVLDGSFSDELGEYQSADFVVRNAAHHHRPGSEEGCLCFAVLDSPLTFTKGPARLLNPILRYKFHRATTQGA